MVNRVLKWIAAALLITIATLASAQNYPKPQSPQRLVNDFANMLSPREVSALEHKLVNFSDTTSAQIAIVTVNSLDGYSSAQYATGLAHEWGVGEKGKDNGVLILLKPKTTFSKGEVYIAVGYGLEGAIPDAMSSRIVRNTLIPAFQRNQIYQGLDKSVDALMALSTGEYSASPRGGNGGGIPSGLAIVIIVVMIGLLRALSMSNNTSRNIDSTHGGTTVIPPIWFFPMGSSRSRSSWGGGSSGGFGGGGSFGGFGGGGFGGGGAGGSW